MNSARELCFRGLGFSYHFFSINSCHSSIKRNFSLSPVYQPIYLFIHFSINSWIIFYSVDLHCAEWTQQVQVVQMLYIPKKDLTFARLQGLPWWLSNKESVCNARDVRDADLIHPWVGKIPWRRTSQPTPVFLPGQSHGQWSLTGYSP